MYITRPYGAYAAASAGHLLRIGYTWIYVQQHIRSSTVEPDQTCLNAYELTYIYDALLRYIALPADAKFSAGTYLCERSEKIVDDLNGAAGETWRRGAL